tara:strand:- start:1675 stop:2436 length:762 start_codon:yes stop_codon:yes gene_type:complete
MSTPLYDAMVAKVRSWVNRDENVLTDSLVNNFLDYSADYCYRHLRIPPLEHTFVYNAITSETEGEDSILMPSDLSELIQFSKVNNQSERTVFNERLSLFAMQDKDMAKLNNNFARKGRALVFEPKAEIGDRFEIYYYRRLADLDATYIVNQANINAGLATPNGVPGAGGVEFPTGSNLYYTGTEVPNWLRDDHERMLLWGAIAHALDYIGEDERALKFFDKQKAAIAELNLEETKRKVNGGSMVATYSNIAQF